MNRECARRRVDYAGTTQLMANPYASGYSSRFVELAAFDAHGNPMSPQVFRFAPSPNGYLHLGHALSALLNGEAAAQSHGRLLLRIEDIDPARSRPEFVEAIFADLGWLGLTWEQPVRCQSEHLGLYRETL